MKKVKSMTRGFVLPEGLDLPKDLDPTDEDMVMAHSYMAVSLKIFAKEDVVPFCFADVELPGGVITVFQLDARPFMESVRGKDLLCQVLSGIAKPGQHVNVLRISMVMEARVAKLKEQEDIDSLYRRYGDSLAQWPTDRVTDVVVVTTETRARHINLMAEVDCKNRIVTKPPHCIADSTQAELATAPRGRFAHLFDPAE